MKRFVAACIIMATAACGGDAGEDAAVEQDGSATAAPSITSGAATASYVPLSRESVSRWMDASIEANRLANENPELVDMLDLDAAVDASDAVERIKRSDEAVQVLRENGYSPEEFVALMMTLSGAMEVHSLRQAGQSPTLPTHVRERDVQFIADNYDWVAAQFARDSGDSGEADYDPDDDAT